MWTYPLSTFSLIYVEYKVDEATVLLWFLSYLCSTGVDVAKLILLSSATFARWCLTVFCLLIMWLLRVWITKDDNIKIKYDHRYDLSQSGTQSRCCCRRIQKWVSKPVYTLTEFLGNIRENLVPDLWITAHVSDLFVCCAHDSRFSWLEQQSQK